MPINKVNGKIVAMFILNQIIIRFGVALAIVSNRGTHLINELMEEIDHSLIGSFNKILKIIIQ